MGPEVNTIQKRAPGRPAYVERFFATLASRGMTVRTRRYARPAAGGEVQAYAFAPAAAPRSLVLLVHASGNDALFPQLGLILELLARRHAVFTFDLDGHGRLSTTCLDLDAARDAVAAATRAARSDPALAGPATRALHLVGQSLGGVLSLAAASTGEVRDARSLTLVSTPARLAVGLPAILTELLALTRGALLPQTYHYGAWGLVPAFGPV
jgi:alpha-beta hydrolase superfamily lysophospholipase